MALSPALVLAPHSRMRLDLRMGRVGSLVASLKEDPDLFNRQLKVEGASTPSRVGDLLLSDAVLAGRSPGNLSVVMFLLNQKAATAESSPDLLAAAVSLSDIPVVDHLVAAGWSPAHRPSGGMSALELAASLANTELLKKWRAFLPGVPNPSGQNLLHKLCEQSIWSGGDESAIETGRFLIFRGVDWCQEDEAGRVPSDLLNASRSSIKEALNETWSRHQSAVRRRGLGRVVAGSGRKVSAAKSSLPRM